MNAESYLRKQGWKGSGHSLDTTGRGIKKPLLIAHKQDQLGLGKKKAAYTTDDQWWMRAFDQSLKSIGTGQESTLNQIRTKGINRGGLYGFFVKGDAIAGTIDDSSANVTDASIPPSGVSTPPTSESETETPAKPDEPPAKKSKRKREDDETPTTSKKPMKDKQKCKKAATENTANMSAKPKPLPSAADLETVARKMAKMSPRKLQWYEKRAAPKNQTVHEYLLRRVQKHLVKKAVKRRTAIKSAKAAATATVLAAPSEAPPAFFTDLSGAATLVPTATATATATQPDAPANAAHGEEKLKKKEKPHAVKRLREGRTAKKEEKRAIKAEEAHKGSKSKWGKNKDMNSRYERLKAEKKAAKEAAAKAAAAGAEGK